MGGAASVAPFAFWMVMLWYLRQYMKVIVLQKLDHTEQRRLDRAHPLYSRWRLLRDGFPPMSLTPEWRSNFRRFLSGVGEPPSAKHYLRRPDPAKLMGPDNFEWRERADRS